jgi:GT2 family glycosyltransferase
VKTTTTTTNPSLTLIIAHHSPLIFLKTSLYSLNRLFLENKNITSTFEVIITVVGSLDLSRKDGLRSLFRELNISSKKWSYIFGPENDNITAAFNRAAERASGTYLLFMSDTTEIKTVESLIEMISVFENDKQNVIGVVGSELFNKRIRE